MVEYSLQMVQNEEKPVVRSDKLTLPVMNNIKKVNKLQRTLKKLL